jgi:Flp pilus assembly protein TadD
LFASQRAIAGQLGQLLKSALGQSVQSSSQGGLRKEVDAHTLEKLQALGYIALSGKTRTVSFDKSLPDPKDRIEVYELIREGTRAAQQNNLASAAEKLSEAARREPNSPIVHFHLGNVFRVQGVLDKAEQEFRRSLELKPDHSLALRRLAEICLSTRRFAEAESHYKKFLTQSPDDFLAHFNLGGLFVLQDRWDEAVAAFRKAEALSPRDARVPTILARILFRRGDAQGALQAARRAIDLDPNQPEAHQTALEIYRKLGMTAEAEKEERILEKLKKN